MVDKTERFQKLMVLRDVTGLDPEAAIEHIGELTDLAFDLHAEDGLDRAIDLAETVQKRELTAAQSATLHYFQANAWSHLRGLHRNGTLKVWDWEQPELEQEIIHLRWATRGEVIAGFIPARLCQINTNLGNTLSHIGRFVEAVEFWKKALAVDPTFGMALGNLGKGFLHYGAALYDPGHRTLFARLGRYYGGNSL